MIITGKPEASNAFLMSEKQSMKRFETGNCKKRRKGDFYTHALYSEYDTY